MFSAFWYFFASGKMPFVRPADGAAVSLQSGSRKILYPSARWRRSRRRATMWARPPVVPPAWGGRLDLRLRRKSDFDRPFSPFLIMALENFLSRVR